MTDRFISRAAYRIQESKGNTMLLNFILKWRVTKMRLIDADQMAIDESEAYLSAQCQIKDELARSVNAVVHTKIHRLIADTPTVDAVEVVRCKDCVYGQCEPIKRGTRVCEYYDFIVRNDYDFCSRGERRNDNAAD